MDRITEDGVERWVLAAGETHVEQLTDRDELANILIDQRADGANCYLVAPNNPVDWRIENVGWLGLGTVTDVNGWGGKFHMALSGTGTVRNVFIDNRSDSGTAIGGALVPRHHRETLTVEHSFIAGCGNNAFYASNSGKSGGGAGATVFRNCYHRDNTVSQFRIGAPGSIISNCIGVVNDPIGRRGTYPGTTSKRARGTWVRGMRGNLIENSTMYVAAEDADPVTPYMVQCHDKTVGQRTGVTFDAAYGNPDAPEGLLWRREDGCPVAISGAPSEAGITQAVLGGGGVPLSAEAAARGERSVPDVPELPGGPDTGTGGDGDGESSTAIPGVRVDTSASGPRLIIDETALESARSYLAQLLDDSRNT